MKNCSCCGLENEETASACRVCGTEFPPSEAETKDETHLKDPAESLVTIAAFDDFTEANIVKSRLEGAGIEACIPEEFALNIFSINKPVEERFTVRVAAKDVDAAREIFSDQGKDGMDQSG
jgi:hypothetical protein